ncbi:hypothetical protein KFK09_006822 [Dendrobium nobile]|uniref:Repressor of RNA polymerase III transcription n=1 Tax=Dendrobium nobile TaxID=94219 RepID=A0A8T3BTH5_DENNO|nr:hypothetical protein KFK09_006822 [Dendrobium nobile]
MISEFGREWTLERPSWILDLLLRDIVYSFLNLWIADMKFLEFTTLDSINLFLNDLNLGESTIKGSLEAYSCKPTSVDRRISDNLEHEILDYLSQSADSDPSSPLEYLSRRSSRRTLIYLVLTLGHMYPDYDFRAVQAHLFFTEEEWDSFRQIFDTYLFEAAKPWVYFNFDIWYSIQCSWSFHFFFYNKKLKRVLSFRCCCLSNLAIDGLPDEKMLEDEGVDDGLFIDMDM